MTQAAVLIQSQFRSYYAQKRYRRSREAATIIQNRYRAYKEHERYKRSRSAAVIIQQRFRSHACFATVNLSVNMSVCVSHTLPLSISCLFSKYFKQSFHYHIRLFMYVYMCVCV